MMRAQGPQYPELQISDEEFRAAAEAIDQYINSLSPQEREELEQMTRKMLTEMGVDPDSIAPPQLPEPKSEPSPSVKEEIKLPPVQPKEEKVSAAAVERAEQVLDSVIQLMSNLQHRASLQPEYHQRFSRWGSEVIDCVYYLKVLTKKEHVARLVSPEFSPLLSLLKKLEALLKEQEASLLVLESQKTDQWEDPYEILGVSPDAPDEEIAQVFVAKKELYEPERLRAEFLAQGIAEQELDREVKNAQLNFELIKDHYLMLSTKESRALIDKERSVQLQAQKASQRIVSQTLDNMINAVSNALYQDQLLNKLEQFMQKYEPKELEFRKKMEKEQEERLKEQKKMDELKPPRSVGVTRKPMPSGTYRDSNGYHPARGMGAGHYYAPPSYQYNQPQQRMAKDFGTADKMNVGGTGSLPKASPSPKTPSESPLNDNVHPHEHNKKGETAKHFAQPEYQILATSMTELDQEINKLLVKLDETKNIGDSEVKKSITAVHDKLRYVHGKVNEADKRKQEQYKTFWKAIKPNAEQLKKLLQNALDNNVLEETLKKDDPQLEKKIRDIISQTTSLEVTLQEKKK